MNKELKLRTAINGYNKTDVEEYVDGIVRDYEKQVEEYKKRFEEAMKIVDEKDDKCYLLETKLAESKIKLDDYAEKEKKMQSSEDNVYQLLGNLEKSKEEINQIKDEKDNLESEIALFQENLKGLNETVDKLKFENGILKEENRIIKSESSKENNAEFIANLEKAMKMNEELSQELEQLKKEKKELAEKLSEMQEAEKEPVIDAGGDKNLFEENRAMKSELLFTRDKVMRLENELDMAKDELARMAEGKADYADAYRSTRAQSPNITVEIIEQAGNIITTAKEEAAKMIRSVSNMYYDAYLEVRSINESIKDADQMFLKTSEKLEKIMESIKAEGQISPIERTAETADDEQ